MDKENRIDPTMDPVLTGWGAKNPDDEDDLSSKAGQSGLTGSGRLRRYEGFESDLNKIVTSAKNRFSSKSVTNPINFYFITFRHFNLGETGISS